MKINNNTFYHKRILILIVAYNAESTIKNVLSRIPNSIFKYDYEILILDDQSKDNTLEKSERYGKEKGGLNLNILYNPKNQGYGGNQKLGYRYAIDNNFDAVILLHGDGQYAPEVMEDLFLPILKGEADAVFGTRMQKSGDAIKGGMPLYKYIGNRILSATQNFFLGLGLSEYHSGYRVYSVDALEKIPFEYNTSDFHFDTEIIIQLWLAGKKITEIPIPTYYGDEICRVNGIKYAWNVFKTTIKVKLQKMHLCYQRKFDIEKKGERYPLKLGYQSSHTKAIEEVTANSKVLDIGCGEGYIGIELQKKGCDVCGIDDACLELDCKLSEFKQANLDNAELPYNPSEFDYILMLDVLEHLNTVSIYKLLDKIRAESMQNKTKIIISTANVTFFIVRLQMMFGNFNYGKRGILDYTHRHLFTRNSLSETLKQCNYEISKIDGIPPPYPAAIGNNYISKTLLLLNKIAIKILPGLFSYQFFIVATPYPTTNQLLENAKAAAEKMKNYQEKIHRN